mmetsp:Transcript_22136/g.35462  ORF Transcript_22136/g.35462 Transcript_22136/m.35462 type:complete len:107 (-) Transcript_22136:87-407(-)|eukprot:CAMPEP_0169098378 /NCGR_PEP_ID=MMETSP1015-20121227/20011_1 /TAXON_ID=342587 /ORGANISM="Karlodinium micrum, Strain CCMP2283" /LENGTH=106 /DNA_ID=CAMNT_0009159227 /DNA_START=69 /DNA_END=389 /DNA_ORIENTATION=+
MSSPGEEKAAEEYKTLWGAKILWPPDVPDDTLEDAVKCAKEAMDEFHVEREGMKVAEKIKKHFDEKWGPYWHITVGKNFGCHLVYEKQRFVYFYMGQFAFLFYKAQ